MPSPRLLWLPVACVVAAVTGAGCNDDGRDLRPATPDQNQSVSTSSLPTTLAAEAAPVTPAPTAPAEPFQVDAPWMSNQAIPVRYTCDGDEVSPALNWSPAPAGTQEIAVALVDDDADGFIHWVMSGIDANATSLSEGQVPEFAAVGVNGMGRTDYSGPCPPAGETHRYTLTVYLLSQRMELGDGAAGADLLAAITSASFMTTSIGGVYTRP